MAFSTELKSKFIEQLRKNKISYSYGWNNYMGTVKNPAALVAEIDDEQQMQTVTKLVKTINADKTPDSKITMRATAGWSDKPELSCCLFPWSQVQKDEYNEGFSFSEVVGGRVAPNTPGTDVIIRFSKKFHHTKVIGPIKNPVLFNPNTPIHQLPSFEVEVSAGVQIAELAEFLRNNNLSLTTTSMIAWVTVVGLAGTAGHGSGRDEPGFSGLIESARVCDMDGTIREIDRNHPDFATLMGGHSGLLGIILSVKIRAVRAFNLCETIELFHNTQEMSGKLSAMLKDNQYVSLIGMPCSTNEEIDQLINKWQIRKWNYSELEPTQKEKSPYAPDLNSFIQELEVRIGSSIMEFLLDSGLKHLLPYFMLFSAAIVTGSRGTKAIVDYENHITHPQVGFPKLMRDVSYLIPVSDDEAGKTLEDVLQKIDELLKNSSKKGEYPVTYAVYARYAKGTNGGLSTSATSSEEERIIAIDIVTHPDAPGIAHFEQQFLAALKEMDITPRHHLGKNFPAGILHYDQFLESKAIAEFREALERWYSTPSLIDGKERFEMSPFHTPYLQRMLSPSPVLTQQLTDEVESKEQDKTTIKPIELPGKKHTNQECLDFLTALHTIIDNIPLPNDEAKTAKEAFLNACRIELEARQSKTNSSSLVL